ncbi:hypothetical protein AUK40_03550 [Candidatus Wirthbacteria bacterium CG2_30_54_11]|uniref:BioF2-like acetyltransferase domain-containing protein n=1 Tax=Candidatus Wirthbacteria bacterium CG2_30_54_11 TaxID=1817892 RepID=A0A1J5IJK4_9BACT|nr:MAG: hypothetical protein AUK40_03550 [Candidatus Wirthbacteria bacterium CG2_30_54_11]
MFTLIASPDTTSWDSDLARLPSPHILQTSSWADFKQSHHWQPLYVYDNNLRLPVLVLKRRLSPLSTSILYVPRGPALDWTNPASAPVLAELLSFLTHNLTPRHDAVLVKVECEARFDNQPIESIFRTSHFAPSSLHPQFKKTMWIDLRPKEDEILNTFHQKTRYNIRLAERKGVDIKDETSDQALRLFYDLHLSTGARGHFPVRSFVYYEQLWKSLLSVDRAKLFLAWHQGDLLGGVFLFAFADRVYYQYGASGETKRDFMPNHLLQWHSMCWAKQEGFKIYDMVGLPEEPDPHDPFYGVWRFKQGFQGETKNFIGAMDCFPSAGSRKLWNALYPLSKRWLWHIRHDVFF